MAGQRPGKGLPFAPGTYSHGGRTLVLATDGGIKVKPGDTVSGYSGCLYRDVLMGWEEYGRAGGGTVNPLADPNLISTGETVYHLPTWASKKAPAPPPTQPPPARDTRLFTLIFQYGGATPPAGAGVYESTITLAGPKPGVFRGSIFPNDMNKCGRIRDGTYDLSLTFHHKNGTPKAEDLVVKTRGDLRPALTVNNGGMVPVVSRDPGKTTATGINVHNGWSLSSRGSEGCLTIQPPDWTRFITIFLDLYPALDDWYEGNGSWRGRKIGTLVVRA